jgi:hypothetical protein
MNRSLAMGIHSRKQRMTVSIDSAVKEELEERVPASKRSGYVERAVADALRNDAVDNLKETLDKFRAYSSGGEDSVEVLRRLRSEREQYLAERHGPKR